MSGDEISTHIWEILENVTEVKHEDTTRPLEKTIEDYVKRSGPDTFYIYIVEERDRAIGLDTSFIDSEEIIPGSVPKLLNYLLKTKEPTYRELIPTVIDLYMRWLERKGIDKGPLLQRLKRYIETGIPAEDIVRMLGIDKLERVILHVRFYYRMPNGEIKRVEKHFSAKNENNKYIIRLSDEKIKDADKLGAIVIRLEEVGGQAVWY